MKKVRLFEAFVNEDLNTAQQKRLKAFFDKLDDETLYDICDDLYHGMDMSYGQSDEYKKWERAKKNVTRKRLITLAMKASIANNLSVTHFRDEVGIRESLNENMRTLKGFLKAIRKEYGPTPTEQSLADFIVKNYKAITGERLEDSDPEANDHIADIIAYFKMDGEDFMIAFDDAREGR